jgi:hypothetical protein
MKRILISLTVACLSAATVGAQSSVQELPLPRIDWSRSSPLPAVPPDQIPSRILPDDPIPVLPSLQDGPAPCPSGEGKSCAALGGRLYFSDPTHMTQHDLTWGQAARNPAMLIADATNLAATVADIEGTQACLHAHTCTEANPIFGSNPSRARAYGTAMPIAFATYAIAALLKKKGDGNLAFAALWAATAVHFYEAVGGFATANNESSPKAGAARAQKFSIAISF